MNSENIPTENLLLESTELLAPGEVVIGQLSGISPSGEALVNYPQNPSSQPLPAISTIPVTQAQLGRQLVLMFTDGKLDQPLIIGFVHSPLQEMIESFELSAAQAEADDQKVDADSATNAKNLADDVTVDGNRVVLEGRDEIVLKCGEASITLTRAGKILIRGKYLLNRSSGVNRILGGSVQVN